MKKFKNAERHTKNKEEKKDGIERQCFLYTNRIC